MGCGTIHTDGISWAHRFASSRVSVHEPHCALPRSHLQPIEDAIQGNLILILLGCTVVEAAKPDFYTMLSHGVKQVGMDLRNPVRAAPRLRKISVEATAVLEKSLWENMSLDMVEHRKYTNKTRQKNKKERAKEDEARVNRQNRIAKAVVQKRLL